MQDIPCFYTPNGLKIRLDLDFFTDRIAQLPYKIREDWFDNWGLKTEAKFIYPYVLMYYTAIILMILAAFNAVSLNCFAIINFLVLAYLVGTIIKYIEPKELYICLDQIMWIIYFPYYIMSNSLIRGIILFIVSIVTSIFSVPHKESFVIWGIYIIGYVVHFIADTIISNFYSTMKSKKYNMFFNDTEIIAFQTWWLLYGDNETIDNLINDYVSNHKTKNNGG